MSTEPLLPPVRPTPPLPRPTLSVTQAALRAGVCRRTIYNWLDAGKIEAVRNAGGSLRIFVDTLFRTVDNEKLPEGTIADDGLRHPDHHP